MHGCMGVCVCVCVCVRACCVLCACVGVMCVCVWGGVVGPGKPFCGPHDDGNTCNF